MPHLEQDVHEAFFFSQEALIAELTSATVVCSPSCSLCPPSCSQDVLEKPSHICYL
jgi:hypothetical protein